MQASSMFPFFVSAGTVKTSSFNGSRGLPFALTTPSTSFTFRSRSLRFWITVRRERERSEIFCTLFSRFSCVTR